VIKYLGPLDSLGRVPPRQQTRVAAFLVSAHAALARQLALALNAPLGAGWVAELNTQVYRETEIVSLLLRATSWVPDLELLFLAPQWEAAWLVKPVPGIPDRIKASAVDLAALGHAVHGAIRPATLLPQKLPMDDAFGIALRKTEFESGRLIQAQMLLLKSPDLLAFRDALGLAVESRHTQIRGLWLEMLAGIGVEGDG
jgi:hypothetical protein